MLLRSSVEDYWETRRRRKLQASSGREYDGSITGKGAQSGKSAADRTYDREELYEIGDMDIWRWISAYAEIIKFTLSGDKFKVAGFPCKGGGGEFGVKQ